MDGSGTGTIDPYDALADELSTLGRRLDGIGGELRALRTSSAAAPASADGPTADGPTIDWRPPGALDPAPPPGASGVAADPAAAGPAAERPPAAQPVPSDPAAPAPHPAGQQARPPAAGPRPWAHPAPQAPPRPADRPGATPWAPGPWAAQTPQTRQTPQTPPTPPRPPRRRPKLSGFQLLAWVGGAVTLLGVVMLLVLAASRGLFTPPFRIGAGALLGVALVGVALRLHRRESARTGALALAATGFATLYLVVVAASAVYDYLPPVAGLAVALVVAGAGIGLADRWRSQLLAAGAVAGAALLAPVLADDWLLVALALALQLAALPVLLRRGWPVLMLVAAGGPVLYGTVVGVARVGFLVGDVPTIAVVLAALVVGLVTAALAARSLPPAPVAVLVAVTPLPAVIAGSALDGWAGGGLVAAAAVALAATAAVTHDRVRLVAGVGAVLALLIATLTALDGSALVTVVLAQAALAAVVGAVLRSRFATLTGAGIGLIGTLAAIARPAPPPVAFPEYPYAVAGRPDLDALATAAGVAALVLATAVALLVACGRLGWVRADRPSARLWVPIGLVALYGAGTLVVVLALLVAPDRTGFTAGHALVTVSWTVAALVLLARGVSRPPLRVAGMVLIGGAVAKLVLFDLVALDGLARVAAFIGAGLLILVAGTRYARLVAEADGAGE
jgi:uncharacterized membrane protein